MTTNPPTQSKDREWAESIVYPWASRMNLTYSEVEPLDQGITRSLDSLKQSLVAEKPKKTEGLPPEEPITGLEFTPGIYYGWGRNSAIDEYDKVVNKVLDGRM